MLAIISKYKEELDLATAHEHKVADEYARVYAEKEARGRVIDSLQQEATMWMDWFAFTLNGRCIQIYNHFSQEKWTCYIRRQQY